MANLTQNAADGLRDDRLRSVPGGRSPPGDPLAARLGPEPRSEVEHLRSTSEAILGRTGRRVHRLGIAASYGIGTAGVEEAIERGVGYLYWGSMRTSAFGEGIRNVVGRGGRERLCVVIQSYTRLGFLMRWSLCRALRRLGIEYADVLLLGWWNDDPPRRILDAALKLRDEGLVKHIALSTHERPLIARLAAGPVDVFHVRYNAAHRGAENEVFAPLGPDAAKRPGLVAFTATRWGTLMRPGPDGRAATAGQCYRFALSHPSVDVVVSGPRDAADLRHALEAVEKGPLGADELAWIKAHGDRIHEEARRSGPFRMNFWRSKSAH